MILERLSLRCLNVRITSLRKCTYIQRMVSYDQQQRRRLGHSVDALPNRHSQVPYLHLHIQNQQKLFLSNGQKWKKNYMDHQQLRSMSSQPYYDFSVILGIQKIFETVHTYTYLPWWSVIVILTIGLRTIVTLPLARKQAYLLAKIELLKPTVDELSEALKHRLAVLGRRKGKTADQVNKEYKKELRKYTYDLYRENNCNPIKLLILPWVQIPLWISISLALRNLSGFYPKALKDLSDGVIDKSDLIATGMDTEGWLWFSDLSVPDPLWIMPIVLGLTNLANIELNALRKLDPSTREKIFTRLFRFLTLGMIGVATQVPAGMALYWTTSSTFGLIQNILIRAPTVRRLLKIPKTPKESMTPYKDILSVMKFRFQEFMKIQRL